MQQPVLVDFWRVGDEGTISEAWEALVRAHACLPGTALTSDSISIPQCHGALRIYIRDDAHGVIRERFEWPEMASGGGELAASESALYMGG